MLINLETCKYYFLTFNNELRKNHMLNEFKDYNLTEVNPLIDSKNKSGSSGFLRILDIASKNQEPTKPFQPFCIFEDDVKKYREFPEVLDVPDDADILYIGLSRWGMGYNNIAGENIVCYTNVNKDIIRIYNMLSCHGMIICSIRGMLIIQKCMMEAYFKDIIWDMFTAQVQPYYNAYALKIPLVYQCAEMNNGNNDLHIATKITMENEFNNNIDSSWVNTDYLCIKTTYINNSC